MICTGCGYRQIGGSICSKCGAKLKKSPSKLFAGETIRTETAVESNSSSVDKKYPFKKDDLPSAPEMVRRKFAEKEKFRRKGFGLIFFWLKNLIFRSIEAVIFCGVFHGGLWLLITLANFFGGFVAPEKEIHFDLMIINQWEYIAFAIITVLTFRKRWGY